MEPNITLDDIKTWNVNPEIRDLVERTKTLAWWNVRAFHLLCNDGPSNYERLCREITHYGNDPRPNEEILDIAALFFERGVFYQGNPWFWVEHILPAINRQIEANNSFEPFLPGYLVKNKKTGDKAIVEYDYATAFGGRNHRSLSLCFLAEDGHIRSCIAWFSHENYDLVDKEHVKENMEKIRDFHIRHNGNPPFFLSEELSQYYYGKPRCVR